MKSVNKSLVALAVGAALSLSVQAAPVNVGGVYWDTDAVNNTDPLNPLPIDFNIRSAVTTTFTNSAGVVSGFGVVTNLNNTGVSTFCPGCELTFAYGGYTPNGSTGTYSNGWFNFYVDYSADASVSDPTLLNSTNTTDGTLWISTLSHSVLTKTYVPGELLSYLGWLDVTGGVAKDYLDTNTRNDGSDLNVGLNFVNPAGNYADGVATFKGDSVVPNTVPEPASLALVGLGLIGAGFARRRKSVK